MGMSFKLFAVVFSAKKNDFTMWIVLFSHFSNGGK